MPNVIIGRAPETCVRIQEPDVSLSRFVPIFEKFAHIWNVDIVAQWPEFQPEPRNCDAKRIVEVNFFHEYIPESVQNYREIDAIFDFHFAKKVACVTEPAYSSEFDAYKFQDFEGTLVAHVQGWSIYLDFDFLHALSNDLEHILRIVLAWGLAKILSSKRSTQSASLFTKYVRELCAESQSESLGAVAGYQNEIREKSLERYKGKLAETVALSATCEANYTKAVTEHAEFERFCEEFEKTISKRDLAKDFDRLRRLEGVRSIRVVEDSIVIATHDLLQIFPLPWSSLRDPTAYDVGSIECTIDVWRDNQNGMQFRPIKFGPYHSFHMGKTICFGTSSNGLNATISKLLVTYKIPDLVAMVLTFFRFVHALPTKMTKAYRDAWTEEIKQELLVNETEVDWQEEKERYIALGVKRLAAIGRDERDSKLCSLEGTEVTEFRKLKDCWEAAFEHKRMREYLSLQSQATAEHIAKVYEELTKNRWFLGLDSYGGIRIWFDSPNVFLYPSILWIRRNGTVRIVSFDENYQMDHHVVAPRGYCADTAENQMWKYQQLFDCTAKGVYDRVLAIALDIVSTWRKFEDYE